MFINVSCSCISGLVRFDHHFNYITKKSRKHFVTNMNAKLMFSIGCFLIFSVSQFNKRYCSPGMLHIPSCNFNTVPLEVFIAAFFSYFASFIVASALLMFFSFSSNFFCWLAGNLMCHTFIVPLRHNNDWNRSKLALWSTFYHSIKYQTTLLFHWNF